MPRSPSPKTAVPTLGDALLVLARNAVAAELGLPAQPEPGHPALHKPGATFVTLMKHGRLRGCIGSLEAHRDLGEDVGANAVAAAFRDSRFPPLAADEFDPMRIEVSLLSVPQELRFLDENDALAQLKPGSDGLILVCAGRRSTFLPQVWESLPQPREFLAQLKRKAGLSEDYWAPDVKLYRYGVQKWKEYR